MKKALSFLCIMIVAAALFRMPLQWAFVVEHENSGKVLGYVKMSHGTTFRIKYTHSIHLSNVVETYKVNRKGTIVQTQLEYEDFGIGMPSDAGEGETFIEKEGRYFITGMDRSFSHVDMRTGQVVANHTFIYKTQQIPFSSFVKEGSWIRMDYRLVSLLDMVKGVNILEQGETTS